MTAEEAVVAYLPTPTTLPADFYDAREALDHIRTAAHSRLRAADAVLCCVLARVATATPPSVTLPAIVGAAGSLNFAGGLVGPSGAGKTSSKRVAGELVPLGPDVLDDLPLGSGEGIVDAYFSTVEEKGDDGRRRRIKKQTADAGFFYLDEGQALGDLGSRKGSTLLPTLRSAWTGDTLGQTNASEDRRRRLEAGTYRCSVVVGFQPDHAVALLADAAGGTPQRFLFLSAVDPSVPDDPPPWPGPLAFAPPERRGYSGHATPHALDVADVVATEVRATALARIRGEAVVDPLDAHRDLAKLKAAALLALLDDRQNVTAADWELAEVVMATSDRVRASIAHHARLLERHREEAANARAARRERVLDRDRADTAALRMARAIASHVHRGRCDGGCRMRCVSRSTRSTDRKVATVDEALDLAVAEGWVEVDTTTIRPGETRPA